MKRRILFLDIDGVLNKLSDKEAVYMNPKLVAILNEAFELLSFEVVVSSTWRKCFDWKTLLGYFELFGLSFTPIDKTPILPFADSYLDIKCRGDEIEEWMDLQSDKQSLSICILDDRNDIKPYGKYLVQTCPLYGIKRKHIKVMERIYLQQESDK